MTQQNLRPPSRPNVQPGPAARTSPTPAGSGDLTESEQLRAEVAALRSAVGRLADEWSSAHGSPAVDPHPLAVRHADRLRSLLASVGSSGEAEIGEAVPQFSAFRERVLADPEARAAYDEAMAREAEGSQAFDRVTGKLATAYTPPEDVVRCPDCGGSCVVREAHDGGTHLTHCRCTSTAPAPVSSGGQADVEGECCGAFVEAACEVGHRILIDDGDGTEYACPACALAARPVLSREALRERIDALVDAFIRQWVPPVMQGHLLDNDDNDGERLRQALADVLTAGGEQRG